MTVLDQARVRLGAGYSRRPDLLRWATWTAAVLACLAWIPFVGAPASPDEGGFLLVAAQWHPGTSLYGNYWVDRPPFLVLIHQVAVALGGTPALRLIGIAGVVATVFLASALLRAATGGNSAAPSAVARIAPVLIAATFLSTPLFGTTQVDGELLSIPFVLAGILALVRACTADRPRHAARWAGAAGVAAACAALVKQNAVDVFVVMVVVLLGVLVAGDRPAAARLCRNFFGAAAGTVVAAVALAAVRGTSVTGLWDAVVSFRFAAAAVIHQSSTSANSDRLASLVHACFLSMAPLLLGVLGYQALKRRPAGGPGAGTAPDLRWPALALLGWEILSIAGGGSYWLHYLLVLVPGLVLLAVAAAQRPASVRPLLAVALALAVGSASLSSVAAARLPTPDRSDAKVSRFLRGHAAEGDTAVVAFGHPNILWDAGLASPYPQLWSLPVRVRDSRLTEFEAVLGSAEAPTWIVVSGRGLGTWGVDAVEADKKLRSDYRVVTRFGRYFVWQRINGPAAH